MKIIEFFVSRSYVHNVPVSRLRHRSPRQDRSDRTDLRTSNLFFLSTLHSFTNLRTMLLCPGCMIPRVLRTRRLLPKHFYRVPQYPTRTFSWSCLPRSRIPAQRDAGRSVRNNLHNRNSSSLNMQHPIYPPELLADALPICCPGCGAYTQTIEPDRPGYYSESRKQVRKLITTKLRAADGRAEESLDLDEDGLAPSDQSSHAFDPQKSQELGASAEQR